MLIPLPKAGEFGCHVTRAWPPDTPEKIPGRMCAGRRCAAWTVVWSAGEVCHAAPFGEKPGRYRATVELGCCGLLPRSLGDSDTDAARMELRARLPELTADGVLKFEPTPAQRKGTVLTGRPNPDNYSL